MTSIYRPVQDHPGIVAELIDGSRRFLVSEMDTDSPLQLLQMTGEQDVSIETEIVGELTVLPISKNIGNPVDPVADLVTLTGAWAPDGIIVP